MTTIATINSAVRTALALLLIGGIGYAGYLYTGQQREARQVQRRLTDLRDQLGDARSRLESAETRLAAQTALVRQQRERIAEQDARIERLDTSLRLLKVDRRLARLSVLAQDTDPDSGTMYTIVQFEEIDDRGSAIDQPKQFTIEGDLVYVDNLIVKFDDKYVENADLQRGTSLVMFRRIFGEYQAPQQGFALEIEGERPRVYSSGSPPGDFERKIWSDFWEIADDRQRAEELGIRALHGEAVSVRVRPGRTYRLVLRASDGLSIQVE